MGKVTVGIMIVGVLLVSLASAGLVGFLSNLVSGTIGVEGPMFWLDKADIMGDGAYSLKMNDNDGLTGNYFILKKGGTLSEEFFSESLGVDDFYSANFDIILESKIATNVGVACDMLCDYNEIEEAENMSNSECITYCETYSLNDLIDEYHLSGTIGVTLSLVTRSGQVRDNICNILMVGVDDRKDYEFTCEDEDNKLSNINSGDRLRLLLTDGSSRGIGTKTYIGDSHIQVVAQ